MIKESLDMQYPSLEQSFRYARAFARKRSWKLWLVAQLFIPPSKRRFVFLSHMYFRWLDDFIDNPQNNIAAKKNLINRQHKLIQNTVNSSEFNFSFKEEYYLHYLIKYLIEKQELYFLKYLDNIIKSFEMDIARLEGDGIFTESQLEEYLNVLDESIFRLSLLFIPTRKQHEDIKGFIGNYFWYVLAIRDFKEDVESGYINICREDISKFNLDSQNILADTKRFIWLQMNFSKILKIMDEEMIILKKMPLLVKMVWLPNYFNFTWELNRLKYYEYKFAVEIKKKYLKEIISFIESMSIFIKFSARVFLTY
jgi:phytoene/squalene synthetase